MASCEACGSSKQPTVSHYPARWVDKNVTLLRVSSARRFSHIMQQSAWLCEPCRIKHLKLETRLIEECLFRLATDMYVLHKNFTKQNLGFFSMPKPPTKPVKQKFKQPVKVASKASKPVRPHFDGVQPGYWPVVPIAERIKQLGEEAWG